MNHKEKIGNPVFVNVGDGIEHVKLGSAEHPICKIDIKRSGKKKVKVSKHT